MYRRLGHGQYPTIDALTVNSSTLSPPVIQSAVGAPRHSPRVAPSINLGWPAPRRLWPRLNAPLARYQRV